MRKYPRKIVQIAAHGEGDSTCSALYALADDETLWRLSGFTTPRWEQVQALPDREEDDSNVPF